MMSSFLLPTKALISSHQQSEACASTFYPESKEPVFAGPERKMIAGSFSEKYVDCNNFVNF